MLSDPDTDDDADAEALCEPDVEYLDVVVKLLLIDAMTVGLEDRDVLSLRDEEPDLDGVASEERVSVRVTV